MVAKLIHYPAEHLRFDRQYDDLSTAGCLDIVGCGARPVAVKKLLPPFRAWAAGDDPVGRYQTPAQQALDDGLSHDAAAYECDCLLV